MAQIKQDKNPLREITGFSDSVEYFEQNKDKKWTEWLTFDSQFEKPGKQGVVGLLNTNNDKKFVFKMSQYINYLIKHEYIVMNGLNKISGYCPHFCKSIGTILCEVDANFKKSSNPFRITSKHPIEKEVLLTEYIDKSYKLSNYINSEKINEKILYSTIKQVLMGIAIAQKKKKFTHYDLHSYNIMMKKCNKDVVFLYILDEDNQFCVPTHGHYPIIIDFGFSYIEDLEDGPCWPSLGHTDVGFMSDRFDWVADPKLFLVTVANEIRHKRKTKNSLKLKRIVKNIFGNLDIDWESGWDNEEKGASDYVIDMLEGYNKQSNLFDNYDHYCIDIMQSLIILPLMEQKYDNINQSYTTFLKEFIKIENEIGNPFYNLYILKGIIDFAREVRVDYLHTDSRQSAIKYFRQSVHERINCIANYCNPKNIHYEKMLCSLFCFTKNIEGILHDVINTRMQEKTIEYNKIPLQSIEQIYGSIESNISDKYIFNKNTTIFVMDCISEDCKRLELPEDIYDELNNIHPISRGIFLYELYKK